MINIDSSSLRKVNESLSKISRQLKSSHTGISGAINRAMVIEANLLRNVIIESMRDTPRSAVGARKLKKGSPRVSKISPMSNLHHRPSIAGWPPAIDSGQLIRSIVYDVDSMEMRVGANMGTMVGDRSYAEILENSENPNMKRPWLKPAVDTNQDRIIENISKAVKKELKIKV